MQLEVHSLTPSFELERKGLASEHALLNQTRVDFVKTSGVRPGERWGER